MVPIFFCPENAVCYICIWYLPLTQPRETNHTNLNFVAVVIANLLKLVNGLKPVVHMHYVIIIILPANFAFVLAISLCTCVHLLHLSFQNPYASIFFCPDSVICLLCLLHIFKLDTIKQTTLSGQKEYWQDKGYRFHTGLKST